LSVEFKYKDYSIIKREKKKNVAQSPTGFIPDAV